MRRNKQSGMTTVSTLFMLAIVGFFFTVFFKLAPHYLDNRMVQSAFNRWENLTSVASQIRKYVIRLPVFLPLTIFAMSI